ncbi:MAG: hypothetical protein CH6_0499 [Candidatus Kapaibacterium sp.]|nr:MAG: hypothetical protein CH6_0499 [Candidatus Kapabacteria bacterium]
MVWFGNIPARNPITQRGSVCFDKHICCFVTPLVAIIYTGGGGTEPCYNSIDSVRIPLHHCSRCRGPPDVNDS